MINYLRLAELAVDFSRFLMIRYEWQGALAKFQFFALVFRGKIHDHEIDENVL